jgi:hypothetical protein
MRARRESIRCSSEARGWTLRLDAGAKASDGGGKEESGGSRRSMNGTPEGARSMRRGLAGKVIRSCSGRFVAASCTSPAFGRRIGSVAGACVEGFVEGFVEGYIGRYVGLLVEMFVALFIALWIGPLAWSLVGQLVRSLADSHEIVDSLIGLPTGFMSLRSMLLVTSGSI